MGAPRKFTDFYLNGEPAAFRDIEGGWIPSADYTLFQLATILTRFSCQDDYFFAFCERKKQPSAPRKSMKTNSFGFAGDALYGSAHKKDTVCGAFKICNADCEVDSEEYFRM